MECEKDSFFLAKFIASKIISKSKKIIQNNAKKRNSVLVYQEMNFHQAH